MPFLDAPAWTPTVDNVALRLLSRTRMPNGALAKTFNNQTQPTATDVAALIMEAVNILRPRLGEVPDSLADSARALATLRAATMVEQSYFSEQVDTGLSPYKDMMGEYMGALEAWDKAATSDEPNGAHIASMPIGTLYPGYATGPF